MQLSRKLPKRLVGFDEEWYASPPPLREAGDALKEMYRRTLVYRFMKKLSPEDRTQVMHNSWWHVTGSQCHHDHAAM